MCGAGISCDRLPAHVPVNGRAEIWTIPRSLTLRSGVAVQLSAFELASLKTGRGSAPGHLGSGAGLSRGAATDDLDCFFEFHAWCTS